MQENNADLHELFKLDMPQIVFKRGTTIGNMLTSSKLHTQDIIDDTVEVLRTLENSDSFDVECVVPCGVLRCKCCKHIGHTSSFTNTSKTDTYYIDDGFNCNSTNLVYIISCSKCGKLYVGQTNRMLKERLNNHRSDIKLHKSTAIGIHFNEPFHKIDHLIITPVAYLTNCEEDARLKIEHDFMVLLNTIYPAGLNNYPIIK